MTPTRTACTLAILVFAAGTATAQSERRELGLRLKRFEAAWEETPDAKARARALAILPKVTGQFFAFQLGEAGRTLDDATHALKSAEPRTAERAFLDSLMVTADKSLVEMGTEKQPVKPTLTIKPFYPVKFDVPGKADLFAFSIEPSDIGVRVITKVSPIGLFGKLPASIALDLPEGVDNAPYQSCCTVLVSTRVEQNQSLDADIVQVKNLAPRLTKLKAAVPAGEPKTIEAATLATRVELLAALAANEPQETDYPAGPLFTQAETLAADLSKPHFKPGTPAVVEGRPQEQWLTVPTGPDGSRQVTPCRLFVPKGLTADKPVPVVVALHGMGGSENLFFEGYGRGHVVKECEQRGWLLLSPRSGLVGTPPVRAILDVLKERYPLDPARVFVVGHSMGGGQAVELAQQKGLTLKGVAVLGGGGRVRDAAAFATLPLFVGVGSADFARKSSLTLKKLLEDAKAGGLTFKEYPSLEHLTIVREALPDVFAAWDKLAAK